ncbi:LysM peptidoglycan-binding domain-containing protein [Bacillus sp. V5-8f]|uniref:LysM peptidoglycan-binding domain-containing protein n=1 Tax=Bacillus sp. V5-8f TaxID=2053044 RepID=UPI000C763697|nr:LysM peptidoglycan-binding domain-containing protein [Bacillus sp. V5-8f]PLT32378.1 hypothetical protein CUU64_19985 [Bacillus sp. V5-8f]
MSKENQSYLRFSLEESIWFQKEHEVAELYSISLDPNVTIQERDQYVIIKGTLDLSGEYKEERGTGESVIKNYTQHYHPKTVQQVERRDSGINEFIHRFPVDITIPFDRIHSLQDVDVEIQTFDYILPDKNCLKLQADLLITGIYREQQSEVEDETFGEEPEEENSEHGEALFESEFNEYTPGPQDTYEPIHHLDREEVSLGEGEMENMPNMVEADFDPFEEFIRKTAFFQSLKGTEDHQKFQAMFERPIKADENPVTNSGNDLYSPFYAEARKLPEDGRAEKSEPELISKQPDIPVFEIPVEPLYDELQTKLQIPKKEPETTHPWGDTKQHSSFDPDETMSGQQEPESPIHQQPTVQPPLNAEQNQAAVQQEPTGEQNQEGVQRESNAIHNQELNDPQKQAASRQEPNDPQKQAAGRQEPNAPQNQGESQQEPIVMAPEPVSNQETMPGQQNIELSNRGEKQQELQEESKQAADATQQQTEQEAPVSASKQGDQEKPDIQAPINVSKGMEEEATPVVLHQGSGREETETLKAKTEPREKQHEPLLNLAKREDAPLVKEVSKVSGQSPSNREKELANQEEKEHVSLMDFFGRKQEEQLTKVKVCIVQHGDTLSSLADRYEVSEQAILSSNALEQGQDVSEGQVLYIPRAKAFKL